MKPLLLLVSSFVMASLRSLLRSSTRFAVLAVSLGSALVSSLAAKQPNILLILTDDQGWPTLGCYGSKKVPTPNLDRLASEGVRFTDAYVM